MNWNQVEGYWTQVRGKVREQWGQITNRQIDIVSGRRAQAVGLLQRRSGVTESAPESRIATFEPQSETS